MSNNVQTQNDGVILLEALKRDFECPVCLSVPRSPPIYQCEKGHIICSSCRPQVGTCPQCRGRLKAGARLYFAERLLDKVPVPCQYSEEGCQVELVKAKLSQHEAECEYREVACPHQDLGCRVRQASRRMCEHQASCRYRPVTCPLPPCRARVPHCHIMAHLTSEHNLRQDTHLPHLASLNSLLMIFLVLSLAINIHLLYF